MPPDVAPHRSPPLAWSWRADLPAALLPVVVFLALAFYTVTAIAPTQEEVFGRAYRTQVVCRTTDDAGQTAERYCLREGDRPGLEQTRTWGPLVLRFSPIRPELVLQIGSFMLPVLEQSYQGAAYALLIRAGLAVFGQNVYGLRLPLIGLTVFILLLAYLLFSRIYGRWVGAWVALLVGSFNFVFFHVAIVYIQTAYAIGLLGMAWLMLRTTVKPQPWHAALTGLLAGVAIYANMLHLAGLAAFGLAALVFQRRQFLNLLRPLWIAVVFFMAPLLPYMVQVMASNSRATWLLADQFHRLAQHPTMYFDMVWQRFEHVQLFLRGSRNMTAAVGALTARGPVSTLGYPWLYYGALIVLLTGWGAGDRHRAAWGRFWALLAAAIPFTSVSTIGTPLNMFFLMDPLVAIIVGLASWQVGNGLYHRLAAANRPRAARVAFVLPALWIGVAHFWLTGAALGIYPYLHETLMPLPIVRSLADYLQREEIDDAVDVHVEDLRYPIEFLTHDRVRLKHHFTFTGARGWQREAAEAEWDRVLALNRGRHFVVKGCGFGGVPSDEQMLREAAARNGVVVHLEADFPNPAGEPVFRLFQID